MRSPKSERAADVQPVSPSSLSVCQCLSVRHSRGASCRVRRSRLRFLSPNIGSEWEFYLPPIAAIAQGPSSARNARGVAKRVSQTTSPDVLCTFRCDQLSAFRRSSAPPDNPRRVGFFVGALDHHEARSRVEGRSTRCGGEGESRQSRLEPSCARRRGGQTCAQNLIMKPWQRRGRGPRVSSWPMNHVTMGLC